MTFAGLRSWWTPPGFVRSFEPLGYQQEERQCLIDGDRAALDPGREPLAFHQFHDQGTGLIFILEGVQSSDIVAVQRGQNPCFASEARQSFRIRGHLLEQDLDGYFAAELRACF